MEYTTFVNVPNDVRLCLLLFMEPAESPGAARVVNKAASSCILFKERGKEDGTICVRGRDLPPAEDQR